MKNMTEKQYLKRRSLFFANVPVENQLVYRLAKKEFRLGVKEFKETGKDNPNIVKYHSVTSLKATDDETPWCASFLCWLLQEAGLPHPASASSQSFLDWGEEVPLKYAKKGDIVVFKWRKRRGGHVGLLANLDKNGGIRVLGGNQSDSISTAYFSPEKVEQIVSIRRFNYEKPKVSTLAKESRTIKGAVAGAGLSLTTIAAELAQDTTLDSATTIANKAGGFARAISWLNDNNGYVVAGILLLVLVAITYWRYDDWVKKGR